MSGLQIAEAALAAAGGEAEAVVHVEHSGLARFAGSEVHQPTLVDNTVVQLSVVREGRLGVAITNRTSEQGLEELAGRAGEAAASAGPGPDFPGLAAPAPFPKVEGDDAQTAALTSEDQGRLAAEAIDGTVSFGAYGFFTSGVCELAVASSTGLAVEQSFTDAIVVVLAATEGASGYAESTSSCVSELDLGAVGGEAAEKAERSRGARGLEPGSYRAVLEPCALGELLQYFAWDSLNGLGLLEERSFLSGRLGERIFDSKISITDDALDVRGLPKRFDFEGTPKQRVQLVEEGVARGVVWDRTTAMRAGNGQASTGHALQAQFRRFGPQALALSVAPGEADSVDELVEDVGDGIYVTRLHYLGIVDPREGILTGMTRDGTFRIRDGKLTEPLVNLRFTVSVPELLADVPGLTRDVRLTNQTEFYDERYASGALVPALATARFHVTGAGSGPGL